MRGRGGGRPGMGGRGGRPKPATQLGSSSTSTSGSLPSGGGPGATVPAAETSTLPLKRTGGRDYSDLLSESRTRTWADADGGDNLGLIALAGAVRLLRAGSASVLPQGVDDLVYAAEGPPGLRSVEELLVGDPDGLEAALASVPLARLLMLPEAVVDAFTGPHATELKQEAEDGTGERGVDLSREPSSWEGWAWWTSSASVFPDADVNTAGSSDGPEKAAIGPARGIVGEAAPVGLGLRGEHPAGGGIEAHSGWRGQDESSLDAELAKARGGGLQPSLALEREDGVAVTTPGNGLFPPVPDIGLEFYSSERVASPARKAAPADGPGPQLSDLTEAGFGALEDELEELLQLGGSGSGSVPMSLGGPITQDPGLNAKSTDDEDLLQLGGSGTGSVPMSLGGPITQDPGLNAKSTDEEDFDAWFESVT